MNVGNWGVNTVLGLVLPSSCPSVCENLSLVLSMSIWSYVQFSHSSLTMDVVGPLSKCLVQSQKCISTIGDMICWGYTDM